ncbi:MAG: hypothetical protein QOH67_2139, partial [Hyphomicrobiales bacterium]|nr:hypothetical protein [Hyphomicrobiales bacterium]
PGAPLSISAPRKNEGSRAPTGAGAEAPHPMTRLAVRSISENAQRSPASNGGRRASRRSAAAFSLRRRAALCVAGAVDLPGPAPVLPFGPERPPSLTGPNRPPSASSWQRTVVSPGGAPKPPGCRGDEPQRAGAAQAERGFPLSTPGRLGLISGHPPARSIIRTSPVDAPRRARRGQDKGGFRGGDKFCDHKIVKAILV